MRRGARHCQENRHKGAEHVFEKNVRPRISAGLPVDPPVVIRRGTKLREDLDNLELDLPMHKVRHHEANYY